MTHAFWRIYATQFMVAQALPRVASRSRFTKMREYLVTAANQRSEFCRHLLAAANSSSVSSGEGQEDGINNQECRRLKKVILTALRSSNPHKALRQSLELELNVIRWALCGLNKNTGDVSLAFLLQRQESRIEAELHDLDPEPFPTVVA